MKRKKNARLSTEFAHFALQYACAANDVIPIKGLVDKNGKPISPYQSWHNKPPKISQFRTFGCPSVYKKYTEEGGKHEPQKGKRGIFVGFPNRQAGWLFVNPSDPRAVAQVSRDAYFDEEFSTAQYCNKIPFAGGIPLRQTSPITPQTDDDEVGYEHTGDVQSIWETYGEKKLAFKITEVPNQHEGGIEEISEKQCDVAANIFSDADFTPELSPKEFFDLQEEMHVACKAVINQNDEELKPEDYMPEPDGLKTFLKLTGVLKKNWTKVLKTEVSDAIKMIVFDNKAIPPPG